MPSVKEFGGQNKMFNNLTFYTDGGCSDNPGPGRFGVVCLNTSDNKKLHWVYLNEEEEYATTVI